VASLALIACLVVTGPEFAARLAPRSAPAGEPRLRVMSYNVYWLNRTPEKARAAVRASGADIVLLIETGGRQRHLPDGLEDLYPHKAFCPCGLTILSRWPILDQHGWPPSQMDTTVSWAVVETPMGRIPVMGVHMHWPTSPGQLLDRENLLKEMAPFDRKAMILMGDFNSTSWSRFMRGQDKLVGLERRTRALPTWPARVPGHESWRAPFPLLPIDQVYAGSDWRTLAVRRGPSGGSDHYSVIVDLARRSAR
jgi:endonuclease/exonuclease/phosphatase (EEP) superfamily protein YafD